MFLAEREVYCVSEVRSASEVCLTKNGYGSIVVMSIEQYSKLKDMLETKLDEADCQAEATPERLSHEDVFSKLRGRVNG